jgi:hypothetical protein
MDYNHPMQQPGLGGKFEGSMSLNANSEFVPVPLAASQKQVDFNQTGNTVIKNDMQDIDTINKVGGGYKETVGHFAGQGGGEMINVTKPQYI